MKSVFDKHHEMQANSRNASPTTTGPQTKNDLRFLSFPRSLRLSNDDAYLWTNEVCEGAGSRPYKVYKGKIKVDPLEYNNNERMILPKGATANPSSQHVSRPASGEKAPTLAPQSKKIISHPRNIKTAQDARVYLKTLTAAKMANNMN